MSDDRPSEHRDEELGVALRELDVPEHRPGFHAELRRRLAQERPARIAAGRRPGLRWGLRVAAVASVAAIVLVAIGLPRTERTPRIAGPEVATAAEVKAQVRGALAAMRNLSGTLVLGGPGQGDERRWHFTLSAEGDFRLVGPTDEEWIVYDASTGVARSAQRSASAGGDTLFYAVRRGVAPGPPDGGPPTWILPGEFAAFVRALLAAADPRVRELSYEGRPAWRLEIDAVPSTVVPEFSGDRLEITVDRQTGIPVRVVESKGDAVLRELQIENLAVDAELPPGTFRLELPAGAEVMRSDEGFRRIELGEIEAAVGYAPLVPAWTPEGYRLAEVAVATRALPPWGEVNPPSVLVVSLSYRRGFDQFLVTTRLTRPASGPASQVTWSDPFAGGEGFPEEPERIGVRGGALRGASAELVVAPRAIPHLWALTDELVVTVAGDLSRAELLRVTESLARHR